MELVLDANGDAASRLIDIQLTGEEASRAYHDMIAQLVRILSCDLIHGDIVGPYNVLWGPPARRSSIFRKLSLRRTTVARSSSSFATPETSSAISPISIVASTRAAATQRKSGGHTCAGS